MTLELRGARAKLLASRRQARQSIVNDKGRMDSIEITAVSDLKRLVTEGYLKKIRNGRNIFYYPTDKIKGLFR